MSKPEASCSKDLQRQRQENFDVIFLVGDKKRKRVEAVRSVLASQSEFFEKLLINNQFKEGELSEIPIEAPIEAFEVLMTFLHTGQLTLEDLKENSELGFELFDLARRFAISKLEETLKKHLSVSINEDNAIKVLNLSLIYKLDEVRDACIFKMNDFGTNFFKSDKISELPLELLKEILSSSLIYANILKFYALEKWLSENPTTSEVSKQELKELVDLKKLSNRQIFKIVGQSTLFEKSFLFDIMAKRNEDVAEEAEQLKSCEFEIKYGYLDEETQHIGIDFTDTVALEIRRSTCCSFRAVAPVGKARRGNPRVQVALDAETDDSQKPGYDFWRKGYDVGFVAWREIKDLKTVNFNSPEGPVFIFSSKKPFDLIKFSEVEAVYDVKFGLSKFNADVKFEVSDDDEDERDSDES